MPYAPATDDDVRAMLDRIGASSIDDLFTAVPQDLRLDGAIDLPDGLTELELADLAGSLATSCTDPVSFLGCGSYDHFVPAVCRAIPSRSEFATAYTPYQPELSQGTLQSIFEFQTCISRLAGLPVANASLYDGATAAAEACMLAEQTTGRHEIVVLDTVSPHVRAVLETYAAPYGMHVTTVRSDPSTGIVRVDELRGAVSDDTAVVVVQQPNAFGRYEHAPDLVEVASSVGAVPVVHADPLSLGVLEAPGAFGAGVCIGDGQALGGAQAFGGPSFGFMAVEERFTRRLPGRIVGESVDLDGRRSYVLTLQTREQHIRREKATSNICTNQALNALVGVVYMSWLGDDGLVELGSLLPRRAQLVRDRLAAIPGVTAMHDGPVFKEFLVDLPVPAEQVVEQCLRSGVHPGWPAHRGWSDIGEGALLVAVTERRTDDDVDALVSAIEEAVR